jgi:hypothetical protein
MQQQFERQYGTRQFMVQPPETFVAHDSQAEVDVKGMARQVLKGEYDFEGEEHRLIDMVKYNMSQSQKYNIDSMQRAYQAKKDRLKSLALKNNKNDKKEFRRGNAKFVTCSTPDVT